ncbi:MAG: SUMF1/EgtB/PvdO family nonheme iron enzyme [Desulfobacterales bacterium]|jgi:formylglycine-generating enzyme required for sulfatase activity
MSDIFISYKREEQTVAKKLAEAFQKKGWSVWWDPKVRAGERFDDVIDKALKKSKCVVVLWSKLSVESQNVKDEAAYALNRQKLVPIKIEEVDLPYRFERINTGLLIDWDGTATSAEFKKLVDDIAKIIGAPPAEIEEGEQVQAEGKKQRAEIERQQKEEPKVTQVEKDRAEPETSKALIFSIVVGAVAVLIVWLWWPPDKTAKPGSLFIETVPGNASINIKNLERPFQQGMQLKPGKYHIEVSLEGYEPQDKSIDLYSGEIRRISFALTKIAQELARLYVNTVPEDATIRILNIQLKFSQGMALEPGSYHLEVAAKGYETERRWVDLAVGHRVPFEFVLTKIAPQTGRLYVQTVPANAQIRFVKLKRRFQQGMELEPGEYHLKVTATDYKSQEKSIVVRAEDNNIRIELAKIKDEQPKEEYPAGKTFKDCDVCPQMIVVPAGEFNMGSPNKEKGRNKSEEPLHKVRIAQPFAVGISEVTFNEWDACVKAQGCKENRPKDEGLGRGKQPVINLSWKDAQGYVTWLRRETNKPYRLLSEAEWEYVTRAQTHTPRFWRNDNTGRDPACDYANVHDLTSKSPDIPWQHHECKDGFDRAAPIKQFKPNSFGLYDTLGNVWEWVEDCWHVDYKGAPGDGSAWTHGSDCRFRILRGGSWKSEPKQVRSAYRWKTMDSIQRKTYGFRVARNL